MPLQARKASRHSSAVSSLGCEVRLGQRVFAKVAEHVGAAGSSSSNQFGKYSSAYCDRIRSRSRKAPVWYQVTVLTGGW